jgi:UDP:flavonoid glycosyltransferase YjiC (YdhE family)
MRLLFSFIGGEGHFRPLAPVAHAAAAKGHAVAVAGAPSLAPVVRAEGLEFLSAEPDVVPRRVPLLPIDMEREYRALRESFAGWMGRVRAAALHSLAAKWRPDVVVRDEGDFGAAVAAERAGIPSATVLVIAAGGLVERARVGEPLDALRAEHGLLPDPNLDGLCGGLVLSPFPPGFRDPAVPLPAGAHAFRSRAAAGAAATHPVVERLGVRPLVYVTLGTIFNTESGDLFTRVLAGLRGLPVEVVVTVGRAIDPAELGPQPDGVHVEQYVTQDQLLPRCAAVVTHAGSGSVMGALEHGLPQVCVPMGGDQPLNAARCAALGLGVALDPIALTPESLRAAVSAVLDEPGYRRAAEALEAEIAALPEPASALTLLEDLNEASSHV